MCVLFALIKNIFCHLAFSLFLSVLCVAPFQNDRYAFCGISLFLFSAIFYDLLLVRCPSKF